MKLLSRFIILILFIVVKFGAFSQSPITSVAPPLNRTGNQAGLGVVPIANGGTAATTKETALNNLLPAQSATTVSKVLTSNGTTHSWQTVPNSHIAATKYISTNYTVLATDKVVIFNGTSDISVALPDPSLVLGMYFDVIWYNTNNQITFNYPLYYQCSSTLYNHVTWSPILPGCGGNSGGKLSFISDGTNYILLP